MEGEINSEMGEKVLVKLPTPIRSYCGIPNRLSEAEASVLTAANYESM